MKALGKRVALGVVGSMATVPFRPVPDGGTRLCAQSLDSPAVASAPSAASTGWWRSDPEWRELRPDEFTRDEATCTVEVALLPGQMVRVATEVNYLGPDHPGTVSRLRLEVRSAQESLAYTGRELARQFARRSESLYELPYTS